MSARLQCNKAEFSHKHHLLVFTEQGGNIKIGTSREKSMCFKLNYKENRPGRKWFLILQLSSDEGTPGVRGAWHPLKGLAGARWELLRVGGLSGGAERLMGRDWLEGKRVVKESDNGG